jgi:hypothetical protein
METFLAENWDLWGSSDEVGTDQEVDPDVELEMVSGRHD